MTGPILLYDGYCALCNFFVKLILRFDKNKSFHFAALDSPTAIKLKQQLNIPGEVDSIILVEGEQFSMYHHAVFRILRLMGYPLKFFILFSLLPDAMNKMLYRWIAKNRYQVFGRYDNCPLPPPENRKQFLS